MVRLRSISKRSLGFKRKLQGGTYTGNPVACAAAVAVVDAFKEERILENVNARCVSYVFMLLIRTKSSGSGPQSFSKDLGR
jgi:adenosylmethionine-8-amino-7-oxononanoate aminotransferase